MATKKRPAPVKKRGWGRPKKNGHGRVEVSVGLPPDLLEELDLDVRGRRGGEGTSTPLDREEIRRAFADALPAIREYEAACPRTDEMALSSVLMLAYAATNPRGLAFVAHKFGSCFGYLKSTLPGTAFERFRVAFRHDENGVMR
jgi:hypothetical protein